VNQVRLGHYFVPSGHLDENSIPSGACITAIVAGVNPDGSVNLGTWNHNGTTGDPHTNVPVINPTLDEASFHLSGECPWKK